MSERHTVHGHWWEETDEEKESRETKELARRQIEALEKKAAASEQPPAGPIGAFMTYKDLVNCPECKRVVTVSEINANGGICGTCRINRHAPADPPPADAAPDDRLTAIKERYPKYERPQITECDECKAEGVTCYCNLDMDDLKLAEWQISDDINTLLAEVARLQQAAREE